MKKRIHEKRGAGILLAVSSLPSRYGIGNFGEAAYRWIDFLCESGQRYWQVLPLTPTGWGDSPYQSFSAFALNPYFIDLEALTKEGLLPEDEYKKRYWGMDPNSVDYEAVYKNKAACLKAAFASFKTDGEHFIQFCGRSAYWIKDYALFMAIKETHGGKSFLNWPRGLINRERARLNQFIKDYKDLILYYFFEQYIARVQFDALKSYASSKGVFIIGDMPIYVSQDSCDLWVHTKLFITDKSKRPTVVAGCPPDPFAENGQLWGNPLYRWKIMAEDGFLWWRRRLTWNLDLYDILRIDHFRGFESFYSIGSKRTDAKRGRWMKGPGVDFIKMMHENFPKANIIAEDLGYQTPALRRLLAYSGYPGIKVLQFAFDSREPSCYMPYNYNSNSVVYTGTHDNFTSASWPWNTNAEDVNLAREFLSVNGDGEWARSFVKAALASVSNTAIIPMQDYLGLGAEARMNTPSTAGGNWKWRITESALTPETAAEIRRLAKMTGRLP
ncbi:MAG: 4-alpha-glucanotransferase [Spirochaetaceae bacterium]|jgi:4-alpha-glucanotransferase|nr:4-alpha-glucanotransferase [Spirochaetaceae bacterium]